MNTPRWLVASGLGLTQLLAFGTSLYLLTVLAQPMSRDTGWPLPWIFGGMTVGALAGAVVSPAVGRWIRRRGGKPALCLSSVLFAAGLGTLAVAPNLVVYFVGWTMLGLGMSCGLYDSVFGALGRLYGLEARRAITTVTLWGGFASTTFWPLSGLLVTEVGWRGACVVFAAMHLLVALPIYRWLLPSAEPLDGATSGAEPAAAAPMSELAKSAVLVLALIIMAETLVVSIISVHLVTILRERGLSLAAAVALGVFIGPAQVSARFGESLFGARYHPNVTMIAAVGSVTLGVGLLSVLPTSAAPLALVAYGAGIGLVSVVRGSLPLFVFGPYEAPVVSGRIGRPVAVTAALAPSIGAVLITRAGGTATLLVLAAISLASFAGSILLRRLSNRLMHQT